MCLDVQPMVPNGSDRPVEISNHRSPLRPLVRVPIRVFPIPERIQGIQSPGEQSNIRKIVALVELFIKQLTDQINILKPVDGDPDLQLELKIEGLSIFQVSVPRQVVHIHPRIQIRANASPARWKVRLSSPEPTLGGCVTHTRKGNSSSLRSPVSDQRISTESS